MENASVREIQHHLSAYLRKVQLGEEIRISRRNRPVAKLVPLNDAEGDELKNRRLRALDTLTGMASDEKGSAEIDSWLNDERSSWRR